MSATQVATQATEGKMEYGQVSVKPGEFAVRLAFGTFRLKLRKSRDYADREFLVDAVYEPIPQTPKTLSKKHGSVVEGLLDHLDWVLRDSRLPCELQINSRSVQYIRDQLGELDLDLVPIDEEPDPA